MDTFHNNDFNRGMIQRLNISKRLIEVLCHEEVTDNIWAMCAGSYEFFNRKYDTKISSRPIRKTIPSLFRVINWIKEDPNEQKRLNSFLIATLRHRVDLDAEAMSQSRIVEENLVSEYEFPITGDPKTDDLLEKLSYQQRPNLGPYLSSVFRCLSEDELEVIKCDLGDFVKGLTAKQASDYKNVTKQLIRNMCLLYTATRI